LLAHAQLGIVGDEGSISPKVRPRPWKSSPLSFLPANRQHRVGAIERSELSHLAETCDALLSKRDATGKSFTPAVVK